MTRRGVAPGWSGKTILVTGGAGYIGSRFVRDLASDERFAGARIRIMDNLQRGNFAALAELPNAGAYEFSDGDVLDPVALADSLDGAAAVVHLAALVRTPFAFDHPRWTEHVNHWGTERLANQALDLGVKRFVFASSASVYGPGGPFDETMACNPVGPYSTSKLHAEHGLRVAQDRGLELTILRIATVFGDAPAVRFDAVPNRFAYLASIGRAMTVHGTGEQLRPILHVADASRALRDVLADDATIGETYNVACTNGSVLSFVDAVRTCRPLSTVRHAALDVLTNISLSLDTRKFSRFGWSPSVSLAEGMTELLHRYANFETAAQERLEIPA